MKKILIIFLFVIILGIVAYKGVAMFGKNRISGKLMDALIVPGPSGQAQLIVLTDGSLPYISKSRSPGKQTTGQKGLFCKTYLYMYNPVSKQVLFRIKTKCETLPPESLLILAHDQVWEVCADPAYDRPHLRVFDWKTGEILMTQDGFLSKFPQLSGGVIRIVGIPGRFPYLEIYSRDGQVFCYSLDSEKLYGDKKSFLNSLDGLSKEVTVFKLADTSGGVRKRLYKFTGPPSKLLFTSISEVYFEKPELAKAHLQASPEKIAPEQVFLEGWIGYQDSDIVVVVHQDQVGENSPRRITCMDSAGNVRWTLSQKDIFPGLARKQKDPFSTPFFLSHRLRIKKSGNTLLFVLVHEGMMLVDSAHGQVLWRLNI